MQPLSNNAGSDSIGQAFIDGGNDREDNWRVFQEVADSVNLLQVFADYGLGINDSNRTCRCPFPSHNDKSPSFSYHPPTKTFKCFGCGRAGKAVSFVAEMEGISRVAAAERILFDYAELVDHCTVKAVDYQSEVDRLIIEYANFVRSALENNGFSPKILNTVREIGLKFDLIVLNLHEMPEEKRALCLRKSIDRIKGMVGL